jgi:hypothetical protein
MVGGTLSMNLWFILSDAGNRLLGAFFGFFPLALAQWLVLRRYSRGLGQRGWWWLVATAAGVCLGTLLAETLILPLAVTVPILTAPPGTTLKPTAGPLYPVIVFIRASILFIIWGVVGTGQWMVLRHRIRRPGLWILVSAASGAASGVAALVVDATTGTSRSLLGFGARWAIYGALTGVVLVFFLSNRIRRQTEQETEPSQQYDDRIAEPD